MARWTPADGAEYRALDLRTQVQPTEIRVTQYLVIVHPAGRADAEGAARYWTEVPALAACSAEGATVEQAVRQTEAEISRWLGKSGDPVAAFDVEIRRAF